MTNRAKIIIIISIAVIIIILGIIIGIQASKLNAKETTNNEDDNNILNGYFNNEIIENEIDNNEINNNEINNTNNENNTNIDVIPNENVNNNYVGREEQESNKGNSSMSDEEKAIELAKNKWGSTASYYNFEVSKDTSNSNIYIVKVRDRSTTQEMTRYYVDVKKGSVTE